MRGHLRVALFSRDRAAAASNILFAVVEILVNQIIKHALSHAAPC
jgi:hypothetical protein